MMCDIFVSLKYVKHDNKNHILFCCVIYIAYICIIKQEVITITLYIKKHMRVHQPIHTGALAYEAGCISR